MISLTTLTTAALQEAIGAFERDDMKSYAHHTGKAGGVAAAVGAYGIKSLSMCDDISDAYETGDSALLAAVLADAMERLDNPDTGARVMDSGTISWPEYGAVLNQAIEAKAHGDELRFALMTGFVSGLLFNNPGPSHPEHGTILDAVATAYEAGSDESLKYAQARIGAGVRHSDPTPFMPAEQYARYREERLRMMRWVQNFGLHNARAADERVAVPGSMRINHAARQQAQQDDNAETRHDQDNSEGEIADLDRAISIDPNDAGAYASRAISKQNIGDHQGAISDWDRALELKPDDGGWCVNRGIVKETIGDYDGALADYNRAAKVEPDYEVAYIARAYVKMRQEDYEGAIADYDRVIELWPDNPAAFDDRGLAKSRQGGYDEAITDFSRAIELQSSNADYYLNRGTAKANAKDYLGAIADFAKAVELDPDKARKEDEPER